MICRLTITTAILTAASALAVADTPIPERPEEIEFDALTFDVPQPGEYRHVLPNGVVIYLAPSSEFPLVNVAMTFKGGRDLDPPDRIGLASMTGAMMRDGGTRSLTAEEFDEQLDFLAANVSARVGKTTSSASLNCLESNLDESMALFMDMLKNPGFQQTRLDVLKDSRLEGMKQRNDDAGSIEGREWDALMYGREHFESAQPTESSITSIDRAALESMSARIFHPGNVIVAVTGDFDPDAMLGRLEEAFADWTPGDPVSDPPAPMNDIRPGVYHVEKDIPQGKVVIGMRGITRDDPDYHAMVVMNDILGGGGFTSRITKRVRSDEGLAYSAGSSMTPGVYYPGEFRAGFQSKNRTVPLAIKIIMEEIERIRSEPVSDDEIATSVNGIIETFPRTFESKANTLNVFVGDEWTGRDPTFWAEYRDRFRAVTADEILRVAQEHLDPEQMVILIVGKWDEIAPGDLEGRASMQDFFGGKVMHLPLRDPMTMEPLADS